MITVPGFERLAPYTDWALPTSALRVERRRRSNKKEVMEFYAIMLEHVEDALNYLNQYPLEEIPEGEKPLLYLCLSLAEVTPYAEWFDGAPVSEPAADFEDRLTIVREPA